MAGLALATTGADAAISAVQITLSNNYISSVNGNHLSADLTGDSVDDIVISSPNTSNLVTGNLIYGSVRAAFGTVSVAADDFSNGGGTRVCRARIGGADDLKFGGIPAIVDQLIPIVFTDSRYGGTVNAWLDARAVGSLGGSSITLERVIWDPSNLSTRPGAASADSPTFAEATAVPEPSGLALLAMGAGGVLTHRRRKQAV